MYMETILEEKNLSCRFIEKDRYQRDVMQCFIDRQDIGSMMVQMGMASDFEKYSNGYYEAEEDYAKSKRIGIWKNMQPNSDKPI